MFSDVMLGSWQSFIPHTDMSISNVSFGNTDEFDDGGGGGGVPENRMAPLTRFPNICIKMSSQPYIIGYVQKI